METDTLHIHFNLDKFIVKKKNRREKCIKATELV